MSERSTRKRERASLPLIVFFANSSEDSTDGRRVRQFRRRVPCAGGSVVLYRDAFGGRLRAIGGLMAAAYRLRPDFIYVELFGYSGLIGGIVAKALFGCRLGIGNGDEVFSTHLKMGSPLRAVAARALERFLWRYADLWAVWSPYHRRYLRSHGVRNVVCVPGAVDLRELAPVDATRLQDRLGLKGKLVVGVAGHLSHARSPDMVLGWDLIMALRELDDMPIAGLVVGDGPGLEWLKALALEAGVSDRVVFTGHVSHGSLAAYYSLMHVGLVTLSNDLDGRFTWTAKLPEYLACNVYAVVTDIERSRSFVRRCGSLLPFRGVKDMRHPAALARLLRTLAKNPELLRRRLYGRALASRLLAFDIAARHLGRGITRALAAAQADRPPAPAPWPSTPLSGRAQP
jgi:glycosyltransferase involved in cell wall biosynthesis